MENDLSRERKLAKKVIEENIRKCGITEITSDSLSQTLSIPPYSLSENPQGVNCVLVKGTIFLWYRFYTENNELLGAGLYDPLEDIVHYLREARSFWGARYNTEEMAKPRGKKRVFESACEMFNMTINNLPKRLGIAMGALSLEIPHKWASDNCDFEKEYLLRTQGVNVRYKGITQARAHLLQHQQTHIREMYGWTKGGSNPRGIVSDEQKIRLAQECPKILDHWKRLMNVFREPCTTWREYAKIPDFFDTPDDLLDKLSSLSSGSKVSRLAIEHAGRRVGIYKEYQLSPSTVRLRQQGIRVTGYTPSHLEAFKSEGNILLSQSKN